MPFLDAGDGDGQARHRSAEFSREDAGSGRDKGGARCSGGGRTGWAPRRGTGGRAGNCGAAPGGDTCAGRSRAPGPDGSPPPEAPNRMMERLHVVYGADARYLAPMLVSMYSVLRTASRNTKFTVLTTDPPIARNEPALCRLEECFPDAEIPDPILRRRGPDELREVQRAALARGRHGAVASSMARGRAGVFSSTRTPSSCAMWRRSSGPTSAAFRSGPA